jgi:hypothetical protein
MGIDNLDGICHRATIKACRVLGYSPRFCNYFDDMKQAGLVACLEKEGRSDGYYWKAAYHTALNEFFYLSNEKKSHDSRVSKLRFVSAELIRASGYWHMDEVIDFDHEPIEDNDTEFVEKLVALFYEQRQKKGRRGLLAAIRDASICVLILRGCDNATIAQELEIAPGSIKTYRARIRKTLSDLVEGDQNV